MKKKINYLAILILLVGFVISGCKEETTTPEVTITEDDAADVIANNVGEGDQTNGFLAQVSDAGIVAGGGTLSGAPFTKFNNTLFDTTIVRTKSGSTYSYTYTFKFSYNFTNLGNQLNFNYGMGGVFDGTNLKSVDSANGAVVVKHIIDTQPNYTATGTYNRKGTKESKVRDKNSSSGNFTLTLDSLAVSKSSKKVVSGSASFTYTATTSTGKIYTFTGTIVFLGNSQAQLTINGKTFAINLLTGAATKQ